MPAPMPDAPEGADLPLDSGGGLPANTKMIYTADMSLETKDFDGACEALDGIVEDLGGWFESRSVDQVNSLTDEILKISQTTRLIALNATVEAANAGAAGKGFSMVAKEIRQLANSSSDAANRIQEINSVVTSAVYNLSQNAQNLVDYMNSSILTEFQEFVRSGKQYQEDAAYIKQSMDNFKERTEHLRGSMSGIVESIGAITTVIGEGASGISGVADSTRSLVIDMEDITQRMGVNQAIVGELKEETVVFDNL